MENMEPLLQGKPIIGFKEFAMMHHTERFDPRYAKNREKYLDYLEINSFFGAEIIHPSKLILPKSQIKDELYLFCEDIDYISFKSIPFFEEYNLSEKEKTMLVLEKDTEHPLMKKELYNYIDFSEEQTYRPSFTEFVKTLLSLPDINRITDEDIIEAIDNIEYDQTKTNLVLFLSWVRSHKRVKYHKLALKKQEKKSEMPAYSYEEYVGIARILFNEVYDAEHDLTKKALDYSLYAEMWLFLAMHYVCGWRASDICDNWVYLNLQDGKNVFGIKIETLKEDILNNVYDEKTLSDITTYAVKKVEMSFRLPSKTHNVAAGKLRAAITPDLRVFFGRLMLIAEYHHQKSGEGYMQSCRTGIYQNWIKLKEFFGEDMYTVLGHHNISSRRLNKSYLQGIEYTARREGNTTLVSHMIASYARNHMDINTTSLYLRDHGLSGEKADVVLYFMLQRGVMGVYLYQTLIDAFPDQFKKLPMKEQTEIMTQIPISAFELECAGQIQMAKDRIKTGFLAGKQQETSEILKAMYVIGQNGGKAKDNGIYCIRKALGMTCEHPTYESCIGNLCPYHIFTREGIPALIDVIQMYATKKDTTGKNKYQIILKKLIIPSFQSIINEIIKGMSHDEKKAVKKIIKERLNG